jgi:TATA-binding protein-associated factor Taf7
VRELPCVVEAFKTYDGQNLVKSNDIGQILVRVSSTSLSPPPLLPSAAGTAGQVTESNTEQLQKRARSKQGRFVFIRFGSRRPVQAASPFSAKGAEDLHPHPV